MSPQNNQAALAALNGVRPVLAHFDKPRSAEDLAADIIDLWTGAERSLQALIGTSALTGQQLIRAARQAEVITIDQAHSLLEFLAARDRANRTSYKPTQADGEAAVDGFKALEAGFGATGPTKQASPAAPARAVYTPRTPAPVKPQPPPPPVSPYAPPSAGGGYRQPPAYAGKRMAGPPTIEMPGSFASAEAAAAGGTASGSGKGSGISAGVGRTMVQNAIAAADSGGRGFPWFSLPVWIGILVVVLLGAGGYFFFARGSSGSSLTAGIDAMQNGQRERARGEFAKAVNSDPNAATPHVFLARIAREDSDLATARAELDTALRLEPKNAVALREMGLVLFASRQYDLARRFFIRAVTANPQDRAAQGYL
ncbi:MAG TPA: tetratricopeptide repeat protein, partial [Gemmatimonadaceae bacterium]|nr:tetratricopeptide repeat protein [Gemmatimonadaceae bacterium]